MVDEQQNFLRKKWLVKTNDEHFHSEYRCKGCHRGHSHGGIEGKETQKSSYYPWKMVQSFARFWAKQTVSTQQLRRMNFNEVNEIDDFDLYAAPEGDADELEAQPLPNVVAEPPNAQGKTNRVPKQGGIQIAFAEAQNPDIAKTNFVEGRRA